MQKDSATRRVHHGWAMYDWANSSYSLVIGTAIFPIYYAAVMEASGRSSYQLFGLEFSTTAAYTFVMAAAYLVVSLVTPYLSAVAEVSGSKKSFMRRFIYAGAATCFVMYFFTADSPLLGLLTPFVASISFLCAQYFLSCSLILRLFSSDFGEHFLPLCAFDIFCFVSSLNVLPFLISAIFCFVSIE